ncbi:MAG: hypothetical protein AAGG75_06195 [Bacteroidota bacterium]
MKSIRAYFSGWWYSFRKIKMWAILFFFNFLIAFICTLPLLHLLDERLGNSLSLQKILPDFDYTVYNDIMHEYGEGISVIINQSWIQVGLFFLLWIFLTGGVLEVFKNREERFRFGDFCRSCAYYFWRIFRLTAYFLGVHILLFTMFVGLFAALTGSGPGEFESELVLVSTFQVLAPIYLLLTALVLMVQDYIKVRIVREDPTFLTLPIWKSVGWVVRNLGSVFFLYLLNAVGFFLLAYAYWLYNKTGKINSGATLLIAFVIGQLFVWLRIGSKLVNLASATILYERSIPPAPPASPEPPEQA